MSAVRLSRLTIAVGAAAVAAPIAVYAFRSGSDGADASPPRAGPPGMRWIPPGEFWMGSDDARSPGAERPAHRVRLDGLWMDATEVTNRAFARFVTATGYVTTAERPVDWEQLRAQLPPDTPKPAADRLQP